MSSKIVVDNVTGEILADGQPLGGGASNLADLNDVSLASPIAGHVLKYNGTSWENAAESGGGGGAGSTGPTGPQGAAGAQGPTGPQGPAGSGGTATGGLSICEFSVGTSSVSGSTSIASGSIIVSIMFHVITPYSANTSISIGNLYDGSSFLLSASDLQADIEGIYYYDVSNVTWGSNTPIKVTISGSPVTGSGKVRMIYATSVNN